MTFQNHPVNGLLRITIGGGFIFAGVLKIADPAAFSHDVANFRLLPHSGINFVAVVLPWIEVLAGLSVLTGFWLRSGVLMIIALTTVFLFAILSALTRGLNIECGCFGTLGGTTIGLRSLAIDLGFLCLAALLMWRTRSRLSSIKKR